MTANMLAEVVLPEWLPWALIGAGAVLLAGVVAAALVRSRAGEQIVEPPPHRRHVEPPARLAGARAARAEPDTTLVESKQVAPAAATTPNELRRKTDLLERLIRDADARIESLERLMAALPREPRAPWDEPAQEHRPTGVRNDPGPGRAATAPMSTLPSDPLTEEIVRLAQAGCSSVEIAQRLGQHVGAVELVLALRR